MTTQANSPQSGAGNRLERWDAVGSIHTAHDIRDLVLCECGGVARFKNSIQLGLTTYHGRCYIAAFGLERFLALDESELRCFTLDDIGSDVMRRLIDRLPSSDTGATR